MGVGRFAPGDGVGAGFARFRPIPAIVFVLTGIANTKEPTRMLARSKVVVNNFRFIIIFLWLSFYFLMNLKAKERFQSSIQYIVQQGMNMYQ